MAAGGYKEFVAGETLDQDEINDYLMQGMLVFAGTAARGSAIGTPVEGQFSFLKDSDAVQYYDGSAWVELSTTPGAAVVSGTTGSPTVGTVSSGGTTYNVFSFTGDGSITFSEAGFAELLIIGAGGGGGNSNFGGVFRGSGGGGAGGYLAISQHYFNAGTAVVEIGAGGTGGAATNGANPGTIGGYSGIGSLAVIGGAGGCSFNSRDYQDGASGGGAQTDSGTVYGPSQALIPAQGNNGGSAYAVNDADAAGGGGGGAGGNGTDGTLNQGGNGGSGISSSITGSSIGRGGGGAGSSGKQIYGTASDGGGSNANGSANTGGGGSAKRDTAYNGGSGIVIVRVAV